MMNTVARKLIGTGGVLILSAALGSAAPTAKVDESGLRTAMKATGPAHGGLGKKIAAKDKTAADDAKKLAAWLGSDTEKYFKKAKASDGITFAKSASTEYKAIAKAVAAGKWDDAAASHKKASATCQGCHTAHREKAADGSYKVK